MHGDREVCTNDERRKAIIVPLHKGIDGKNECNNFRGINLLLCQGKYIRES